MGLYNKILKHTLVTLGLTVWLSIVACGVYFTTINKYKPINKISYIREFPQTIERCIDSSVHIVNKTQGWQGSGVAITDSIILTAAHVVDGGDDFIITLNNGIPLRASQAISSKKYDLGFIKVNEPILTPAIIGSMEGCALGQQVFTIGSPYGKLNFNSVTLGIISGLKRDLDTAFEKSGYGKLGWSITFQTDAAGHPGNSGCPIYTMDGVLRGILVGGFSPVLIYGVPANLIMDDIKNIDLMFTMNKYEIEEVIHDKWDSYSQKHVEEIK